MHLSPNVTIFRRVHSCPRSSHVSCVWSVDAQPRCLVLSETFLLQSRCRLLTVKKTPCSITECPPLKGPITLLWSHDISFYPRLFFSTRGCSPSLREHERSGQGCHLLLTADYWSVSRAQAQCPGEHRNTEGLRSRDLINLNRVVGGADISLSVDRIPE